MAEQTNLLELIRAQAPKVVEAVRNAGAVSVDNLMKAEGTVQGLEKTYEQAGRDQALVVQTAQIGALNAQQAARRALDERGGMQALYDNIATLRTEEQRIIPALDRLREENKAATGLNLIGIIKQRLDWNGTQAEVESTANKIKTVADIGTTLEQKINAAGTIARNTAETMTVASVEAATRVAQAEWAGRAAQARLEGLKYNTQSMEAIASAEDKTLEVLTRAQNVERGEQQYQLALRDEERKNKVFNWQQEKERDERLQKLEGKALDDNITYKFNLARSARGLPPIEGLEAKQMIQLLKANNPDMIDLYRKGDIIATTGISLIGYSPADTAAVIAKNPQILKDLPPERQKALALIVEAQRELAVAQGAKGSDLADDKDGSKAAKFINDKVREKVAAYSTNVGNNFDNPFHLGDLTSYIGTAKDPGVQIFQSYPLVQKVLNPAISGGMSLADPNIVVGQAMIGVRRGDLTSSQAAADISNIYRRANLLHRRAVGFETLGISLPAAGAGYVAKINGENVDVTDFVAVARAMNKQMLRDTPNRAPMGFDVLRLQERKSVP